MTGTERACVVALLAVFLALGVDLARRSTATVDEYADLPAGMAILAAGDFSLDARNPPLMKVLAALAPWLMGALPAEAGYRRPEVGWWPWVHGKRFFDRNADRYDRLVLAARLPVLALGALTGVVLWRAARRRHGIAGGLLSLLLWCLDPTVLAHSSLATTDLGAAAFFFFACLAVQAHVRAGSRAWLAAAGVLCGLALASKFSSVLLLPGLALALLWALPGSPARRMWASSGRLVAISLLTLLVLQAAYGWPGARALPAAPLRTPVLRGVQGWLAALPLPLPPELVLGFDDALAYARDPELPGYLDGRWSSAGFWDYHLRAFVWKEPVVTLLLLAAALALGRRRAPWEPALLVPPLLLLASLLLWNRVQYGLRYALPLYPFLFLAAGRLGALARPRAGRASLVVAAAALLFSALATHPHELSYFNRLAGPPERTWTRLCDSNLDWGQDLGALAKLLRERHPGRRVRLAYFGHVDPAHYGIDHEILRGEEDAHGLLAVSASYLAGQGYAITWRGFPPEKVAPGTFRFLHAEVPVARVGYSIYLYERP